MKNTKLILIILTIAIIGGGIFLVSKKDNASPDLNPASSAWKAFDSYRAAASSTDIGALKKVTYKLGATCSDKSKTTECKALMSAVYEVIKDWNQSDFTGVWSDKSQVFLFTSWEFIDGKDMKGYERREIYLVRDLSGRYKVLYYTLPAAGIYTKNTGSADAKARLDMLVSDSDQDAVPDKFELCGPTAPLDCVPTSTSKRDSDADGYWDGFDLIIDRLNDKVKPSAASAGTASTSSTTDFWTKPFGETLTLPR